jgi:anti-anti-sigma regulatory factor
MEISVTQQQGVVPVTILKPHGPLDASSYRDLISKAQEQSEGGARFFLIDMSDIPFMSSAGIVSLHVIALILRGDQPPDPEAGWEAYKSIDRDRDTGKQKYLKLLNPNPNVDKLLAMTGFKNFLEVHTNQEEAVGSFEM